MGMIKDNDIYYRAKVDDISPTNAPSDEEISALNKYMIEWEKKIRQEKSIKNGR